MGKEGDIPEIPMDEQVRNELLDIQKGQRQLTAAETACFVRVLAEVISTSSLRELKTIATQRVPRRQGFKPFATILNDEFDMRRGLASETNETVIATLNHVRVLLAQRLILQEIPETRFLGYAQRVIRRLSPASSGESQPTINVRVNKRYL